MPQGREVFAELTMAENLDVARKALSMRDPSTVEEVAALFPALRSLWRCRAGSLSGGQQQQLAIAHALIGRPGLLLLDEPTEGIQPSVVQAIEDVIHGLKGRMTILLVEQYLDFAREIADSFGVMSRGTMVAGGPIAQLDLGALQHHLAL